MPTLNQSQSHLIEYISKYRSLLKEIGDSITDCQAGCGNRLVVTQEEQDWLIFNYYPLLRLDLRNHIPDAQAKEVLETVDRAAPILASLCNKDDYNKYSEGAAVSRDLKIVMDALTETENVLNAIIPGRTGRPVNAIEQETELRKGDPPKMSVPLGQIKWANILHVSIGTTRTWQRDESKDRKYHFDQVSMRKWRLPLDELPAEYLDDYKKQLENMRLKQTQNAPK